MPKPIDKSYLLEQFRGFEKNVIAPKYRTINSLTLLETTLVSKGGSTGTITVNPGQYNNLLVIISKSNVPYDVDTTVYNVENCSVYNILNKTFNFALQDKIEALNDQNENLGLVFKDASIDNDGVISYEFSTLETGKTLNYRISVYGMNL